MSSKTDQINSIESKRTLFSWFSDESDESDEEKKESLMKDKEFIVKTCLDNESFAQNFIKSCSNILSFEYNFGTNDSCLLASISKLKNDLKFYQSKVIQNIEQIYSKLARWILLLNNKLDKLDWNKAMEYNEILTILKEDYEYKEAILLKEINVDISFIEIPTNKKFSYIGSDNKTDSPNPNTLLSIWDKLDIDITNFLKNRVEVEDLKFKQDKETKNNKTALNETPKSTLELFYLNAHEKLISLTQKFKTNLKNK